ncbi:MAG TPA: phosphoenolpyruvate carboxylase [Chitinophagaceae bacterium]|jgi:phosphoenolpyruvate carboxylase|nr:phosphoenolpyruvate carboxylase [Chitinophagaceae bacterium]
MDQQSSAALQQFKNLVGLKFQLYNSLFTSLPFHRIEKTGILLSLLLTNCEDGYKKRKNPVEIIEEFFSKHTSYTDEKDRLDLLFRFVQYSERQVVLFDALEDSAYRYVNDMNGPGTLKQLETNVVQAQKQNELKKKLEDFSIRLVLTAHPTQFYPGAVLGIIHDLSKALLENNTDQINMYLQQLGKTPFFKKQKPTPYDEAISLIWYLENVFYPAAGRIVNFLKNQFTDEMNPANPVVRMGFWPGGDRDGNPFVTTDTTLQVADALRSSIIKCYYLDVRKLKRRLTFDGVDAALTGLEKKLYNNIFIPGNRTALTKNEILQTLNEICNVLIRQHNGLFINLVRNLINRVEIFGLYFASLDIRQESSVHGQVLETLNVKTSLLPENYSSLNDDEKIQALCNLQPGSVLVFENELEKDTIESMRAIKAIQSYNGEDGCNRFIISQCNSALNIMEVFALFKLSGWKTEEINIDIVPLFETVADLERASNIMKQLYENENYFFHLKRRGKKQTIMLGFSDGTKDGGYLMANWSIYKAKEELTKISKQFDVDVIFFDGRGGPPARGGGKTHKFYASLGKNIANNEIQLTVQGQTVSSSFGTIDAAQFNMEQLINAGITNDLFSERKITLQEHEHELIQLLADESYEAYNELKNHPYFLDYLSYVSPLQFYADTNIGSRPAKRGSLSRLTLKDLRAIPFVGSWSQVKQNVTGYYGVGRALKKAQEIGCFNEIKNLYKQSLYFKTLIDNCEMAMKKCFFPLTAYLATHPEYGEIWEKIYEEYELTQRYIFLLSGKNELMADYPVESLSIQMRERIVLPLATIQQYAIIKMREIEKANAQSPLKNSFGKLAMRCSFGIINAGRNSA